MKAALVYQNGVQIILKSANDPVECIEISERFFKEKGTTLDNVSSAFTIRIYFVSVNQNGQIIGKIIKVLPSKKLQSEENGIKWEFRGNYQGNKISIDLVDNKNTVYPIWDILAVLIKRDMKEAIKDLDFTLTVNSEKGSYSEHQKLILFFSKKENCGKLWKYDDIRKVMLKEDLAMSGRGIEGERPREFRYMLGYPFLTSEQNKNIADGYCMCEFPFPTMVRNERRNANLNLSKEDWSELLSILKKDSKRLRCFECGLFEGETNKIGQKTKFEKGHLIAHLSAGGDSSKENITAICKYCNSLQKDIFSYDVNTGKKIYHVIPFIKNQQYHVKQEALQFLLKHMKKEDIKKEINKMDFKS